jgi:cell division septation protein DedD
VIELQRHIEILLLEHDCVIVPDFGGFMAHAVAARYDADDRMFLPPLRTLGFNPQLRMNDSVLVQSYVEAYDLSYPEALRRIESEVGELKQQLSDHGHYDMDSLGTLTVNQEGNYEFEPGEAGILSPTLYGLSSFSIRTLGDTQPLAAAVATSVTISDTVPEEKEESQPALLDFTDDDDDKAVEVKLSWIRNAVAVAAAVAVFFLMATPVANGNLGSQTMSQLQHHILYKLLPQDTNMVPAEPVQPVVAKETHKTTVTTKADETPKTAAVVKADEPAKQEVMPRESVTTYCIVVASQVKKSNAEMFVDKLHQQGYKEAQVYIHNDVVRVICGEYATEGEAYQHLNKLNEKEEFWEAWVYKKKAEA